MWRILRAFAWLRWRMVLNAFDKTGGRDIVERFSLAAEQIGPLIAVLLLVPTAAILSGLGVYAGIALARGEASALPYGIMRFLLLAVPLLAIIGPLFLPAADRTNPVRLLLLPIPRATLYVAQSSSAFGDPWNILAIPLILALTVGLFIGKAVVPGLLALIAAVLLIAVLIGLSSIAASLLHLVVRNRRRGELIGLLLVVVLPALSMFPAMLSSNARRERGPSSVARERRTSPAMERFGTMALAVAPTEMYLAAARSAAEGDQGNALRSTLSLAGMAGVLHLLGFVAFKKVLDSPGSSSGRRNTPMRSVWAWRLPGLSAPASAVALAQLRLALRTPRGRSIILSPLVVFLLFGAMMYRNDGTAAFGPFHFTSGIGLATVTSFFAMLAVLPIAMNQFAVDRAGLTLALLSPLREAELLAGKAVGNALIVAPPALVCMIVAGAVFPGDPVSLWVALPLGLLATYVLAAPIAAMASATFPRVANLNSIGRGGNPHGLANFIGMLALLGSAAIPLLLALASTTLLHRPALAPLFIGGWCVIAFLIARALFVPAVRIFHARRENLALLG